ncbi:hypothetical protein [Sphingobium sp. MK2]|uniref:hypothetical protein n=1 Tax=Sphingobium sp. MK2 TaxID=3116540 RepID=UPI0032E3677A
MNTPNQAEWRLAKVIMGKSPDWRAINGHERQELRRIARLIADNRTPIDRDRLADALYDSLNSVYDCTRVWEAWSYGTMTANDFHPTQERAGEIADEIIGALTA